MNSNPIISIIVPVFKVEKYLSTCLDSISGQTFTNIEIICVFTESPDLTRQVLSKYEELDNRIKVIYRNDGGLGGARNYGLKFAKGEYIVFVDSDDWIAPDMCEKMYNIAQLDNSDIVICGINSFDDSRGELLEGSWGYDLPFSSTLDEISFTYKEIEPAEFISDSAPVVAWNKIYKKSFLDENHLTFPEEVRYEDNPFYYEAMIKAGKIRFTRERYYFYRVNRVDSLQASSFSNNNVIDIVRIMGSIKSMLDENHVSNKIKKIFLRYMVNEFAWRYMMIKGNKRKLLKSIMKEFSGEEYELFLKELSARGVSLDTPIIKRASSSMPKVSVIIPAYNNEKDIKDCLDSVLSQTLGDIEIICVNDASSDSTAGIIDTMMKTDNRVKLINVAKNAGAGTARNLALRQALGEYVFFLDADDLLPDNEVLGLLYNTVSKNNALVCGGNIECFQNDNVYDKVIFSGHFFNTSGKMKYAQYTTHPTWGFTRFLYNLEIILENGICFPEVRYYEDPVFFVKYMENVRDFYAIDKPVYLYRQKKRKKETFSKQKFIDLFSSLKIIFPLLSNINLSLYYCEYNTFLHFCDNLYDYISQNEAEKDELAGAADTIFALIDFSKARGYLEESLIFDSFGTFVSKYRNKQIIYSGSTIQATEASTSDFNFPESHVAGGIMFSIKRLIKALLKPVYHRSKRKFIELIRTENDRLKNDVVWLTNKSTYDSEERINKATYEIEYHINRKLSDIEEQIKKAFIDCGEHINKAMYICEEKISSALTESVERINKTVAESEERINKTIAESEERINKTVAESEERSKDIINNIFTPYINKVDLLNNYLLLNARNAKKIFLIGTPDHNNIGDASIALGTYEFISNYFSDYKLIDIPGYHMEEQYHIVHALIDKEDLIFLQGGGNLGDMYPIEENIRRRVINDFPGNKITILPQTIFFSDTAEGKKELGYSSDIYNRHRNLKLFTRGLESLAFAREHFPNIKSFNALDMALFLKRNYNFERNGILLCMRDITDESAMDDVLQETVIKTVEAFAPDYQRTKNHYVSNISLSERALVVNEELKKFARHKVIVTDRLHGLIFAVITRTPCVVMKAYTQKIREFSTFFTDSNAVFYIENDLSALHEAINKAFAVDESIYPALDGCPFDDIFRTISDD